MNKNEYARQYRQSNASLINARRRAQRAALKAGEWSEPVSESEARGRRCNECGERVAPTSYYKCLAHIVVLEDFQYYSVGRVDSVREE